MIARKFAQGKFNSTYRNKTIDLMKDNLQSDESINDILNLPITDKQRYEIMVSYFDVNKTHSSEMKRFDGEELLTIDEEKEEKSTKKD